jgi:hypothetical protein
MCNATRVYRSWGTKVAFKKVLTVLPEYLSTSTTGTSPTTAAATDTTTTTAATTAAASTTATAAASQQQGIGYAGAAVAAARDVAPVLDLTKDLWQKVKGIFVKDEEPADPALPIQVTDNFIKYIEVSELPLICTATSMWCRMQAAACYILLAVVIRLKTIRSLTASVSLKHAHVCIC